MSNLNVKKISGKNRLILAIGNSRLYWAWFQDSYLIETWNTPHLSSKIEHNCIPRPFLSNTFIQQNLTTIPIIIASVVPQQTKLWQNYLNSQIVTLKEIKLHNIYATMGIDRALTVWGGGETYGYPCLVIDGGTALTFTGVDRQKQLVGGAILPGLRSQFLTLHQKTAALPKVELPLALPPRWASDTNNAIASGIIHTTIAGIYSYIDDWQQQYPDSQIIFTGGDGKILSQFIQQQYPELKSQTNCDRHLIFYGINFISK
jgi:type III pantothenate kinase